ncbi:hypothetical protein CC86DRAFT_374126 [Ophiobolus disseminans]|uniref:Uncharacterized protein n=1 Tax=Ophiobolus disseminans TaxID=1469910 RepID=A0A6A6ZI99_9PLEO|nr:hypothetical protein CC86DRAFT_374126 [Ophiobolus disseminans]
MALVERTRLSSRAATWARASPALGSQGLSLAEKATQQDTPSPQRASPGHTSCESDPLPQTAAACRLLPCRLARFFSALFQASADDSNSDAGSTMGGVAIGARSREKQDLHKKSRL